MSNTLFDETVAILERLIAFPTVSSDGNLALITYAAKVLSDLGARLTISNDISGQKANLFASIGPDVPGGIVLSGHTDVVPVDPSEWTSDPFELREADGLYYGRGTCDMKGFIAAVLAILPDYAKLDLARPVHIALTYDEEVGCLGARQLADELRQGDVKPSVCIIGEPTMMRVIEGHKGCYEYTTCFHGTDGHGSEPDKGVNAIHYAAKFMNRLLVLGEELKKAPHAAGNRFSPPWTTVQVGRIEGGSARNVIARRCEVEWEMRPVRPEDGDWVKAELEQFCREELLPGMQAVFEEADITTEIIGEVEGLQVADRNEARDIVTALTGDRLCDVVAFGTEAGLFQSLGMSVVVCGPGSISQAHQPDEFISGEQLQACLNMLEGLKSYLVKAA
ncbi:acetylornithine deacetylase [Rhizobium sp. L1K21]|uniref:acetylornithine deacetylase n=1 Tax=Rhizobium sp. L1K21 TaxID=2954933 RepID=UPI0020924B0B|nr:acetylornithine deacetylase [Rhizobium sp. L1K21]